MVPAVFSVRGNIVDIHAGEIFAGEVIVEGKIITAIRKVDGPVEGYITPGFVDAHIHIESSMLTPAEFSRAATPHGTVATVSDPHEIANVLGVAGVEYMIAESRQGALKTFYGAPSCVPATKFESAGAELDAKAVADLLARPDIFYLSEVMNFPGVIAGDESLRAMIAAARALGKPVDGHAPSLNGKALETYAQAGISTDHESSTLEEARAKLGHGIKTLIREGSAARNYAALEPLLFEQPEHCMFCSDDMHPDALAIGHINLLARRAVAAGVPPLTVLRVACKNPVEHYHLPVGLLRVGDPADFLVLDNLENFNPLRTYIDGELVAEAGRSLRAYRKPELINRFHARPIQPDSLKIIAPEGEARVNIITVEDGQLLTRRETVSVRTTGGVLTADAGKNLLKIAVLNRYSAQPPALGLIKNIGLQYGAIASSVAHDSHNIVAVGTNDEDLCRAINLLIAHEGGVCAVSGSDHRVLPLPVAGLMSDAEASEVAINYSAVEEMARTLGSPLRAPLMTLSFMALLVIPEIKLSDKGLFDGGTFQFLPLIEKQATPDLPCVAP